ncbi:trans-acting enoyl reductase [Nannizzia gypsea CBS 118893]|uniref:Trans-acting enoyl reductase n=1 Tax=Arthroderma gypseum (strain ATCC MYA-4604 / CBS 118893) TaxID=535722 RepID=E4V423_ARTGP|nr:trans-acting enoyl reductase [Nannizzia gypsea CBS 118893]EFR04747.1 trans-acting enoyl reductase [Nannizzia gypsea CBS 118893]
MEHPRTLEIVLLGATGYTGKLCAEHIVKNLPTNLAWGIAGRSAEKLEGLSTKLQALNNDRKAPEILSVQLKDAELKELACKTKVIINCVGPYRKYSTPVVKACAENGTHYVDVTGEAPWVRDMIQKFHETAKSTGAILISANGIESAPADLLTYFMAKSIKDQFGVVTDETDMSLYHIKGKFSGGTLRTIIDFFDNIDSNSSDPYCTSVSKPAQPKSVPILRRIFGVHYVPDIGVGTTCVCEACDTAIVHRTSSLMPQLFNPNFRFWESMKARNIFTAVGFHFALIAVAFVLLISPVRWILPRYLHPPGEGLPEEAKSGFSIEYRGISTAKQDQPGKKDIRVLGSFCYDGCPYRLTGIFLAEAARILARSEKIGQDNKGGYLTPASLEDEYIENLEKAGAHFKSTVLEH